MAPVSSWGQLQEEAGPDASVRHLLPGGARECRQASCLLFWAVWLEGEVRVHQQGLQATRRGREPQMEP